MALVQICTQMPVPPELQAQADMLAVQENPLNGHQITAGGPVPTAPPDVGFLALPVGTMWKTGRTLRVKILNGSDKIKSKIQQYANVWSQFANIQFQFVDSGDAEIRVNNDSSNGSWSYVGTNNLIVASDQKTMNFGWFTDATAEAEFSRVITHEFGHAIGCIHEHNSPAADIPWNKPAVYAYYEATQGWTQAQVDTNIFQLYDRNLTQFSAFDTGSIMLYAIPSSLTTNGFSTGWNTELSETDKTFIAGAYPTEGLDIASFNTMEIRPWDKPAKQAVKRQDFKAPFSSPPSLAVGLNWLDVAKDGGIRVNAFADKINTTSADVHIDTWADTTLWSAGCTWFTASAARDPDFQVGQFSTTQDHPWDKPQVQTSHRINFDRAYGAPPLVVVWLNELDMAADKGWRIRAYPSDVDAQGFTIHLDTWADTTLWSGTASWIAYPAGKAGVVSGSFSTQDVRPWNQPQLLNEGRVNFPAGAFQGTPTVLIALNSLDFSEEHGLRLKLSADSVSKDGMNWHINSWADSVLYSAAASYIAFES